MDSTLFGDNCFQKAIYRNYLKYYRTIHFNFTVPQKKEEANNFSFAAPTLDEHQHCDATRCAAEVTGHSLHVSSI